MLGLRAHPATPPSPFTATSLSFCKRRRRRRRGYTGRSSSYAATKPSRGREQRDPLQGLIGREQTARKGENPTPTGVCRGDCLKGGDHGHDFPSAALMHSPYHQLRAQLPRIDVFLVRTIMRFFSCSCLFSLLRTVRRQVNTVGQRFDAAEANSRMLVASEIAGVKRGYFTPK
jgi:hypothetical protein